jgi:pyridoxine 4-dehydrogenase
MAQVVEKAKDALHLNKKDSIKLAGLPVHGTGYGLMGLTWRANPPPQEQAFEAMSTFSLRMDEIHHHSSLMNGIEAALENGANFWNGG